MNSTCITTTLALSALLAGCQLTKDKGGKGPSSTSSGKQAMASAYDKPGFHTAVVDGKLWVLKGDQQESEKHITLISKGPAGMSIKALDKQTAMEYLTQKPGFRTEVDIEHNRLWVLRGDQQKSDKHITFIRKGPGHMSVAALDRETALLYLATRPGFQVEVEDGRLWVLREGQEKSEKHITKIGAGPLNATVKAIDRATLLEYLGTIPGFVAKATEDGRLWIFPVGASAEMPEKHVTRIGRGPTGVTVKASDRKVLDAYVTGLAQQQP